MKIIKPSFEIIEESDPLKKIEICGRVCYKSEDKITPDSSVRFVQNIIKRGHESVLEHANFIVCCDSYDMNMFVNICDYARSFDSETILLRTTQKNRRNIISGNARMWRDFMRYTQKIGVTSNIFTIFKGILFDDVNTTTQGRTTAKFVDEKFLTEEEREIHCVETVRFITDRGVSHEIVRHRMSSFSQESTRYCRYNDEVTFIKPCFDVPELWYEFMQMAENTYISMLENSNTPQEARSVLPNEVKTEIIMTTNRKNWRHFFELRTSTAAHPQMRELAIPLQGEMLRRWEDAKNKK